MSGYENISEINSDTNSYQHRVFHRLHGVFHRVVEKVTRATAGEGCINPWLITRGGGNLQT